MPIICCIVWGILTLATMWATTKYYLPKLSVRAQRSASEVHAITADDIKYDEESVAGLTSTSAETEECLDERIKRRHRIAYISLIIVCALFAAACGYVAAIHYVSIIGLLKMTVAFITLACVFITDFKLKMITNVCSIVLVSFRLLTIIYEFIWVRESAMPWLINSIIAGLVCLLLFYVMYKVTKGGIGLGDIKIISSTGFLCGISAIFSTLVLAFLASAVVSTAFLLMKKKKLKDSLPLGPFIWAGFGISVLLSIT